MISLAPLVGLLIVAAVTPGPNNVMVMTAAMKGGWTAAMKTLFAIVSGSLLLFFLIRSGLDAVSLNIPLFASAIAIAGAVYLAWLGLSLMRLAALKSQRSGEIHSMSAMGVAGFQLINPKGWVLMSVFVAGSAETSAVLLIAILVVVFVSCLTLWALAGVALSSFYANSTIRFWVDRAMGAFLLIFSVLLAAQHTHLG